MPGKYILQRIFLIPGIVIVTDGVFNLNDASVVDAVLAQMRTSTVVCSFLHVGGGASCGYVLYISETFSV